MFAVMLQLPIYVYVILFVLLNVLHHFSPRKLEDKHWFLHTQPPKLAENFPKVLKLLTQHFFDFLSQTNEKISLEEVAPNPLQGRIWCGRSV